MSHLVASSFAFYAWSRVILVAIIAFCLICCSFSMTFSNLTGDYVKTDKATIMEIDKSNLRKCDTQNKGSDKCKLVIKYYANGKLQSVDLPKESKLGEGGPFTLFYQRKNPTNYSITSSLHGFPIVLSSIGCVLLTGSILVGILFKNVENSAAIVGAYDLYRR
jgi:hypothetical protein